MQRDNDLDPRKWLKEGSEAVSDFAGKVKDFVINLADLKKIKNAILKHAADLPGFTLLTVILEKNPITNAKVERTGENYLQGLIEVIPFVGKKISQAFQNHKIYAKATAWLKPEFQQINHIGSSIAAALETFFTGETIVDFVTDPGGAWEKVKADFKTPVDQIKTFVKGLVPKIITLIRESILRPVGEYVRKEIKGYPLLCSVLGKDPITDEEAPQDASAFIGRFLIFIDQAETWKNLQKANTVEQAGAWWEGKKQELKGKVSQVTQKFANVYKLLTDIKHLIDLAAVFKEVRGIFDFPGQFISWGASAVWELVLIIFEGVAPPVAKQLKRAGGVIRSIVDNPGPFASNLVLAGKQGLRQFVSRFPQHLKAAFIEWLTGGLAGAGIYIPQSFSIKEIIKLVLSVLGVTWGSIRIKLAAKIGEKKVARMESKVPFVQQLVSEGPVAAWQQFKAKMGNVKGMIIDGVISFVVERIIIAAVEKLVAALVPVAGGVIEVFRGIYGTYVYIRDNIGQMGEVLAAYTNSIVAIAQGQVGAAAKRVEKALASSLVLVIKFMAMLARFGKVGKVITRVVKRVGGRVKAAKQAVVKRLQKIWKKVRGTLGKLFGKKKGKRKGKKKDKKKLLSPEKVKDLVYATMGRPTKAKEPKAALAEKKRQARRLIAKYKGKLKKGRLKIKVTDRSVQDVEKDAAVDFAVSASPGKRGEAKVPIDKDKEKKKIINRVVKAMRRPTKAKTAEEALKEKQDQALRLKAKFQPKLKKGTLRIDITDRSAKDVEKDATVDFAVSASQTTRGKAKTEIPEDIWKPHREKITHIKKLLNQSNREYNDAKKIKKQYTESQIKSLSPTPIRQGKVIKEVQFDKCWHCNTKDRLTTTWINDHIPPRCIRSIPEITALYKRVNPTVTENEYVQCYSCKERQATVTKELMELFYASEQYPQCYNNAINNGVQEFKLQIGRKKYGPIEVEEEQRTRWTRTQITLNLERALSDLYIKPGPYTPKTTEQPTIQCHHCGAEIPADKYEVDHMPPNAITKALKEIYGDAPRQRLLPNCPQHAREQGGELGKITQYIKSIKTYMRINKISKLKLQEELKKP